MGFVAELSEQLGVSEAQCRFFLAGAGRKYKVFRIPKKMGGYRVIAQPSAELKKYQRAFLKLFSLPSHPCAMAYVAGRSIKDNALAHANNSYILKTDIVDFFHSIDPTLFWRIVAEQDPDLFIKLQPESQLLNQLLFWKPSARSSKLILSIGAPTSPVVSNFCMFSFDKRMNKECKSLGISYTRYADDMTFSSPYRGVLTEFMKTVRQILNEESYGKMLINTRKTVWSSKAHNRHVTGITLSNDGTLSLGREKKRFIRHLVHKYVLGTIVADDLAYLHGYLSFAINIEPEFLCRLRLKYSDEIIEKVLHFVVTHE